MAHRLKAQAVLADDPNVASDHLHVQVQGT